jgi:hypothetical protein
MTKRRSSPNAAEATRKALAGGGLMKNAEAPGAGAAGFIPGPLTGGRDRWAGSGIGT